jgi:hypothetical protein
MGCIQLYSGRKFDPIWPTPSSFTLEDVLQGMLEAPRFAGQYHIPYKVAQHCLTGARWFRKRNMLREAKFFLWHEGAEGLGFCDLPTPIKYLPEMEPYRILSNTVDLAVFKKAGLLGEKPKDVKDLDTRMAAAEAKVIMNPIPMWSLDFDTTDIIIRPSKNSSYIKQQFIKEYNLLFPEGISLTD